MLWRIQSNRRKVPKTADVKNLKLVEETEASSL
jgi:hypothetical protein